MGNRNAEPTRDPLFVGATRPPMRWGVTYSALLFNMVFTMEAFLLTKNLLTLMLCAPIHGICMLLCARDARFFDLALLYGRTRLPALFSNLHFWKAASYSPLIADIPDAKGLRRLRSVVAVHAHRERVQSHVTKLGGGSVMHHSNEHEILPAGPWAICRH